MNVAVIGGGMAGIAAALRLAEAGLEVVLLDAAPRIGGVSVPADYGSFRWDRFYHCILPSDVALLDLLETVGVRDRVRWRKVGTGIRIGASTLPATTPADVARLPGMRLTDTCRFALSLAACRWPIPPLGARLDRRSCDDYVRPLAGERTYRTLWKPILRSKLGDLSGRVPARYLHAIFRRMVTGGRGSVAGNALGYLHGGYEPVLNACADRMRTSGVVVRASSPVRALRRSADGWTVDAGGNVTVVDGVVWTGPLAGLRPVLPPDAELTPAPPPATAFLGIVCLAMALPRPLSPYYMLLMTDDNADITGIVEMSNLTGAEEMNGRHLVYIPRYVPADSPSLDADEDELRTRMLRAVQRVVPAFDPRDAETIRLHRARHVQALRLLGTEEVPRAPLEGHRIWAVGPETDANLPATNDTAVRRGRAVADTALRRLRERA